MQRGSGALVLLLACGAAPPATAQELRLQGDPRAVAAIEKMIERMGGAAVWSRAHAARVIVRTTDGRERGFWQIDDSGAVVKWGAPTPDGGSVEYVYGPLRAFGNVNFPAWGASVDGAWRWTYTAIDVSTEPFSAPLERPR